MDKYKKILTKLIPILLCAASLLVAGLIIVTIIKGGSPLYDESSEIMANSSMILNIKIVSAIVLLLISPVCVILLSLGKSENEDLAIVNASSKKLSCISCISLVMLVLGFFSINYSKSDINNGTEIVADNIVTENNTNAEKPEKNPVSEEISSETSVSSTNSTSNTDTDLSALVNEKASASYEAVIGSGFYISNAFITKDFDALSKLDIELPEATTDKTEIEIAKNTETSDTSVSEAESAYIAVEPNTQTPKTEAQTSSNEPVTTSVPKTTATEPKTTAATEAPTECPHSYQTQSEPLSSVNNGVYVYYTCYKTKCNVCGDVQTFTNSSDANVYKDSHFYMTDHEDVYVYSESQSGTVNQSLRNTLGNSTVSYKKCALCGKIE